MSLLAPGTRFLIAWSLFFLFIDHFYHNAIYLIAIKINIWFSFILNYSSISFSPNSTLPRTRDWRSSIRLSSYWMGLNILFNTRTHLLSFQKHNPRTHIPPPSLDTQSIQSVHVENNFTIYPLPLPFLPRANVVELKFVLCSLKRSFCLKLKQSSVSP